MKKVMVLVAVIAMALVSQAASVAWKFNTNAATWNGYTVYAVSSLSAFSDVSEIESAMLSSTSKGTIAGTRSYVASGTVTGDWAAGESVPFYYVVVNTDESAYWTSAQQTATAVTTGTPTVSVMSPANGGALLSTAGTSFSSVPEPTTAALLLLGLGALALKRKIA